MAKTFKENLNNFLSSITIKTEEEIEALKSGGKRLAFILQELSRMVIPGVSAEELDHRAGYLMEKYSSKPSFFRYRPSPHLKPYPANICVCVNDVVVHGIPDKKIVFQEGDVVTIDAGLIYNGMFVDSAVTVGVGRISPPAKKLISVAKQALDLAIKQCLPQKRTGDIGYAIQSFVRKNKMFEIHDLVGHGVGYAVHEPPEVPNFGEKGRGVALVPGMVIAIEPMVALGTSEVDELPDGSFVTADGSLSAEFEHTIVITRGKPIVVTRGEN